MSVFGGHFVIKTSVRKVPHTFNFKNLMSKPSRLLFLCFFLLSGCTANLGEKPPEGRENPKSGTGLSSDGSGGISCGGGTVGCGSTCVALDTSADNCGACGTSCAGGQFCSAGSCQVLCADGESDCNGVCLLTDSDPANCGACGNACAAGQFCDAGACSDDCSGDVCSDSTGVEQCVHLDSNPNNCGSCGEACSDRQTCERGTCVTNCAAEFTACGAECVIIKNSASNCGACGVKCDDGVACVEGKCGVEEPVCTSGACLCSDAQTLCGDSCIDTQSNLFNCGDCDKACVSGQKCTSGSCACDAPEEVCADTCVDKNTDENNCGNCGKVCGVGQTCNSGSCECDGSTTMCTNACRDLQTDDNNCGRCDKSCASDQSCKSGTCECSDGLNLCSDSCTNLQTDEGNCGSCGESCVANEQCIGGTCQTEADGCEGPARAIDISQISVYQAVQLNLYKGSAVSTANRKVPVVQDRDAMVRVFVKTKAGFNNRQLSARISIDNGGTVKTYFNKLQVTGNSSQSNLGSTFRIEVPGRSITANSKYYVEIVECGTVPTTAVGNVRFPTSNFRALDAKPTGVIKVVFIPVKHDGRVPNTSNSNLQKYVADVARMYATTGVEFSVGAVLNSNQSGTNIDLSKTLDQVTDKRTADAPAGDVYYYGLIDPASSANAYCQGGCTTGVGWLASASTADWASRQRAAVGVGFDDWGVGTFSHELGHNHGRDHAPCNVSGDNNYPYGGGKIGVWGYDRDAKKLKNPANVTDFMGYCNDTWVSDYSYKAYFSRIAALNGTSPRLPSGPLETWARMLVTPRGASWSQPAQGYGTPTNNPEKATVYNQQGDKVAEVDAHRMVISDGGGYMLYLPTAEPGWFAVGVDGGPILPY